MMHQARASVNALQGKLRNQFIDEATRTDAPLPIVEIGSLGPFGSECGGHLHDDHKKVTQLAQRLTLCFDTHRILVSTGKDGVYPCVTGGFGSDRSLRPQMWVTDRIYRFPVSLFSET